MALRDSEFRVELCKLINSYGVDNQFQTPDNVIAIAVCEFIERAWSHSKTQQSELNIDHDEARALHRIVRAMHDGECPKCHSIVPAASMRKTFTLSQRGQMKPGILYEGCKCSACGFEVDDVEAREVLSIFAPFMERNLAIFEKWRESKSKLST